jgi:hypothetical protein
MGDAPTTEQLAPQPERPPSLNATVQNVTPELVKTRDLSSPVSGDLVALDLGGRCLVTLLGSLEELVLVVAAAADQLAAIKAAR